MNRPTFSQREAARDAAMRRIAPGVPAEVRERVRRENDAAPPLTQEQKDLVAVLLDGYVPDRRSRATQRQTTERAAG